jgi:hypothetical protein
MKHLDMLFKQDLHRKRNISGPLLHQPPLAFQKNNRFTSGRPGAVLAALNLPSPLKHKSYRLTKKWEESFCVAGGKWD